MLYVTRREFIMLLGGAERTPIRAVDLGSTAAAGGTQQTGASCRLSGVRTVL